MAIDDLPLPVVNLLNVIGVPWPYINEDTVWQFASLVRQFGQAVQTTHQDATESVAAIAESHKSVSTQVMKSGWAKLSAQHVDEIVAAAGVLADALDAAGGYIVAQKGEAILELAGMAAAFVADQAAAFVTFGASEAALPLIEEAAAKLVESLEMDLQQYIAGQVIDAAAKPLFAKIDAALSGLDWSQSGVTPGKPDGFSVDPGAVAAQTAALRGHAASLRSQAAALASSVRGLKF
ncbi:MAG TPA: hypothetical protein VKS82_25900 [Streptosporangiaceae bacterium]|jgi:hypothetical protein|nr:hypothetical protein [Streptosporangiaceae bacterium]